MATFTAFTTLDDATRAEALGAALERLDPAPAGVGVFELEDGSGLWEVGGYFEQSPDAAGLALLSVAFGAAEFKISELPQTDWVAKVQRELSPVVAGPFFVHGRHDADHVPAGAIPLRIEASMAFGTGHHGTTLGCLQAFVRLLEEGFAPATVADIGCGTALLAMAAARVTEADVIASDIDAVAVDVAMANLAANGLDQRVTCVEAAGFDHPALVAASPFDLIFANILKGPLIALAPDLARSSSPNGRVILSGILNNQADEVAEVYRAEGLNTIDRNVIVDWTTLTLAK